MQQPPQGPQWQPPTQYPPYQQWPPPQQPYYQPQWRPPYQQPYPPPMMQPPKKSYAWLWLVIAVVLIILFAAAANHGSSQPSTTSSTQSTPTPILTSPGGIELYTFQIAKDSGASGSNISSNYDPTAKSVVITETLGDQIDNKSTIFTIHDDCYRIQKALWQSSAHLNTVEVHLLATLVDKYGRTSVGPIGICTLNKKTAQKFNWDNLTDDQAWQAYDDTWILPSLNLP